MTPPTQDDLAAGYELDALVAEKVMGLRVERGDVPVGYGNTWVVVDKNGYRCHLWDHAYSTDIAAAWTVLDEMVWRVGTADIRLDMEDYGRGAGTAKRAERAVWVTIGEHTAVGPAPLAICKAALMAMSSG